MSVSKFICATAMVVAMLTVGCAQEQKGPVERAVDKTKDALDVRDHEKLRDAGESATQAVKEAKEGVKDAVEGKK